MFSQAAQLLGARPIRLIDMYLMRARTATIVKEGTVPFEVATWLWTQVAVADAEDQARMQQGQAPTSDAFTSRRCPSPSIRPSVDPQLEQWKYQYGYDPLCSVSWTHIATEHIGLDNPPSPCCGSRATFRKVLRQQTAEAVLYPVDVKLPMFPAPSSSIFSAMGSGVKLTFTVYGQLADAHACDVGHVSRSKGPSCRWMCKG